MFWIIAYALIAVFIAALWWRDAGDIGPWRWAAIPAGLFWPVVGVAGIVMIAWVWIVMDDV